MPRFRRPPPFWLLATVRVGALLAANFAQADYADEIGLRALRLELGAGIPTGAGVAISQIEASLATPSLIYMPDTTSSEFSGKTIVAKSGVSTVSGHASTVGVFYYGITGSLSPGVTTIDVYEANSWVFNGFLKTNTVLAPAVESRRIQNHSWIGTVDNGGVDDIEILRRFDFAIQRDDFFAAVGLNNGSGNPVPALLANAYNAVSVGLTDGNHSTGVSTVDGAGRVKPEIVAPSNATSFATPLVGSAAALLRQNAPATGQHSVTLKALLLAGATKDQFANWSRSTTRPLDAHFGAGQLNVFHSHHILAAGKQTASNSVSVAKRGWDYTTSNATVRRYFFDIPALDGPSRFSAVLTWNRIVADTNPSPTAWGDPSSDVPNLALRLSEANGFVKGAFVDESVSAVDNVEHVFAAALAPGRYVLEVTGDQTGIAYGLAWNTVASVTIAASAPAASERGSVPATFTFTRTGDLTSALTVPFSVKGNAVAGADYQALPTSVTIPANQASATLAVSPLSDAVAEGDETVTVTLASGLAATFADANATVTIHDQPIDAWRFTRFSVAELNDPAASGDFADFDRDGIVNLVEYALGLEPKVVNSNALPAAVVGPGGVPQLTYAKVPDAVDINYVVEVSTNLVNWNPVTQVANAPALSAVTTTENVTVSAPTNLTADPVQFMRLRVTRQ